MFSICVVRDCKSKYTSSEKIAIFDQDLVFEPLTMLVDLCEKHKDIDVWIQVKKGKP